MISKYLQVLFVDISIKTTEAANVGVHLCQSLFFNKPASLLKKRLWHRYFPVNFAKFLRTHFLQNTSWWLLLKQTLLSQIFSHFLLFFQLLLLDSNFLLCPVYLLAYGTSDNETPPIAWVLTGQHLIFYSLTSPPCCNSSRKRTPVKHKKRQKLTLNLLIDNRSNKINYHYLQCIIMVIVFWDFTTTDYW